ALFQDERQGINLTFIIPLRRLYCTILLPTMPIDQKDSILSQDTFRQIFQSSAEGIIIVNEEGRIFLANPVAEKMFGYDPGELADMHLGKLLPERFRARHAVHRDDYFRDPRPRRMGVGRDLLAARKDGSEFPVEVSLSSVTIDGNALVIAFIIDITLRKKSEEALRRSEEQRSEEHTSELQSRENLVCRLLLEKKKK